MDHYSSRLPDWKPWEYPQLFLLFHQLLSRLPPLKFSNIPLPLNDVPRLGKRLSSLIWTTIISLTGLPASSLVLLTSVHDIQPWRIYLNYKSGHAIPHWKPFKKFPLVCRIKINDQIFFFFINTYVSGLTAHHVLCSTAFPVTSNHWRLPSSQSSLVLFSESLPYTRHPACTLYHVLLVTTLSDRCYPFFSFIHNETESGRGYVTCQNLHS